MKKILYPIVIFLLTLSDTYAQNWECIKADDEYYFGKIVIETDPEPDTNMVLVETIKIDSVYSESDITVYRNHKSLKSIDNCYKTNGPSILGKKVFSDNAGYFHFINKGSDTIHIKSNAVKDETWVFCVKSSKNLKFIAYIDTIVYDSLSVLPDSVKIIRFLAQNLQGDTIQNSITDHSLKLSKNNGLLSIFDFRLLPEYSFPHNLVGTRNTHKGYRDSGLAEIWDMEIGDEFHFKKSVSSSSCPNSTYYIKKIVGKNKVGDTLYIDFAEWGYFIGGILCSGDEYYPLKLYTKTINPSDPMQDRWNSVPGESYEAGLYAGDFKVYISPDSLLQEKRHCFPPLKKQDISSECFGMDIDPTGLNGYYFAIKGAGGYFFRGHNASGYGSDLDFSLKYYKKGNKIYGSPFDYGEVMGWWPFNTHRILYWGRNMENDTKVAELEMEFNTLFKSHITAYFKTVGLSGGTCWKHDKVGIFGKDILTDADNYFFINRNSDTILYKPFTSLNQEWIFYKKDNLVIKAKCQAESTASLFGVLDSIRSYSFQAFDLNGIPIDHPVNGKEIKSGKDCGIFSSFDFYYFPDSLESQNYTLNGYYEFWNPQGSINGNLKLQEVYNIKVGDRIDLVNTTTFEGGHTVTETIKYLIAKAGSTQDTLTLDYRVMSKITTYYDQGDSTVQYLQDTISQIIDFTDNFTTQFNKKIGNIMEVDGGFKIARLKKSTQLFNGLLVKEINPVIYTDDNTADSCLTSTALDCGYFYIQKLGGPYENCSNSSYSSVDRLVSYQSSGNVWGSPFSESYVLGIHKNKDVNPFITVYPNPAQDILNISISDNKNLEWTYEIYNTYGKQIMSSSQSKSHIEVNLEKLASGMYIYRIINKHGSTEGKFIKE